MPGDTRNLMELHSFYKQLLDSIWPVLGIFARNALPRLYYHVCIPCRTTHLTFRTHDLSRREGVFGARRIFPLDRSQVKAQCRGTLFARLLIVFHLVNHYVLRQERRAGKQSLKDVRNRQRLWPCDERKLKRRGQQEEGVLAALSRVERALQGAVLAVKQQALGPSGTQGSTKSTSSCKSCWRKLMNSAKCRET